MSVIGGRGGRQDDWPSPHARARARAAERLDGPIDAAEAAWLGEHLASCPDCSAVAADYAAQRLELRALRDRPPVPPRDLWARTAAALERDSPHGRTRSRRASLRPYVLLAGALVVAIAVGTLSSSRWPLGNAATTPGPSEPPAIAVTSPSPTLVAPTPLAVGPQDVAYLSHDRNGSYTITTKRIDEVCPSGASDCVPNQPHEDSQTIGPIASPETVFGGAGKPLVVMGTGNAGSSVFAIAVPTEAPGSGGGGTPSASPEVTASAAPTATPVETSAPSSPPATSTAPTPETTASPPATESPTATPSEPASGAVEIARGLQVVDANAAYAPDGSAFAFTAQPADGSHGPDIYVWTVGDKTARPVTSDHHSVFGSWSADGIVGSSVDVSTDGASAAPSAIVVRGSREAVGLPEAGRVWRPAVAPGGESAVYWSGSLAPATDGGGWKPRDGRLVIGRWGDVTPEASASATAPAASEQARERHETTIAEGPLTDWDARWDQTGTRLAVWVADRDDPTVGKLSLYVVDPFDNSIDLADPPLHNVPAMAGFSIDDGRLAWATPDDGTDQGGRVLILAWTEDGFGQVESAPGDFLLVR
jgi:hypothetical protein